MNKIAEDFILELKDLFDQGMTAMAEGTPVKISSPLPVEDFGCFLIREYEGFSGRDMATGKITQSPSSLELEFRAEPKFLDALKKEQTKSYNPSQVRGLKEYFQNIRSTLLSGEKSADFPGVGKFQVVLKTSSSGQTYVVSFRTDAVFHKRLQELSV